VVAAVVVVASADGRNVCWNRIDYYHFTFGRKTDYLIDGQFGKMDLTKELAPGCEKINTFDTRKVLDLAEARSFFLHF